MKLATKTALTAALFSLAVGTGAAHAAPMGGIPGGDFESGFASGGTEPLASFYDNDSNLIGQWNWAASANASSTIVTRNDSKVLRLWQEWQPRSAHAWFTASTAYATPTDSPWEIGADLAYQRTSGNGANKAFRLRSGDQNSTVLFQMRFNFQGIWYATPGQAEVLVAKPVGSPANWSALTVDMKRAAFHYDPITGAASGYFDGQEVFNVTTTTGLSVRNVQFSHYTGGDWDPGQFFVDNVYAVPEPASMALLGLGSVLMLARRRRQMA
ncbi:PEP-CTERM sorting domain-containing protein [Phycisphaerales bacterium AB-hyl4]|uniref:PEP-CTERM sorting domain-containing protein n=1 Tax=Natronomicrosphaera hydrolytica TaxID=3242702 RepID=A0ABV4U8C9_9BACT